MRWATASPSARANAWFGGFDRAFLGGVDESSQSGTLPETVFLMFQMTFAIITPALIIGGFAERTRFSAVMIFSALWLLLVYAPVAHWVWGGGWLQQMGLLDFAGGTVVHITAGVAALVAALVIGNRNGFGVTAMPPHNMTMTVTGAGMLWVGWFGFNAGSALAANGDAGMAMLVTHLSAAAGRPDLARHRVDPLRQAERARCRDRPGRGPRHHHAGLGLRRAGGGAADRHDGGHGVLLRDAGTEARAEDRRLARRISRCTA